MNGEAKVAEEARHRGLGRGLSALMGDEAAVAPRGEATKAQRTLPVAFLKPNRFQPRKSFAPEELTELRLLDQPALRQLVRLRRARGVEEQVRHEALSVPSLG